MIIAIVYLFVAAMVAMGYMTVPMVMVELMVMVGFTTFGAWAIAAVGVIAFALAAIIDADTVKKTVSKVTDTIGSAVGSIGKGVGEAIGGVVSGVSSAVSPMFSSLGSVLLWGAGLFVGYKYLTRPDTSKGGTNVPVK